VGSAFAPAAHNVASPVGEQDEGEKAEKTQKKKKRRVKGEVKRGEQQGRR
jgi:hypothetical protein